MNRRTFVRTTAAAIGCPVFITACAGLPYVAGSTTGSVLSVPRADLGELNYALVEAGLPAPVFLSLTEKGAWSAISLRCTHRGCVVKPSGAELECPCHGSRFTFTGSRLGGPAPTDLPAFRVEESPDTITIYLTGS